MASGQRAVASKSISIEDRPVSPADSRILATYKCEPTLILVGASCSPTSEKRNSINKARPREFKFTRQDEKSSGEESIPGKLASTCQPVSPVSAVPGNLTGKVPRLCLGRQRPFPTNRSKAA